MGDIAENLGRVRDRIRRAAMEAGRDPDEIGLVAVSKKKPAWMIKEAMEAGQLIFGENYAQEFIAKDREIREPVKWHFIGALQRNKVKYIVDKVDIIHSVDRISLAEEIQKRANKAVKVLLEINLSGEESKAGTGEEDAFEFLAETGKLDKIEVCGLMTMPPFFDDPLRARPYFRRLRELRDRLTRETGLELRELSMGMSGDFEVAIEEGATLVRVGTAIFGER